MKKSGLLACILSFVSAAAVQAADIMRAFPPAGNGMVRFVLHLPERSDEELLRVELIVGKTVQIDSQNRYFFGGRIEAHPVPGWGYTRYVVDGLGPMAGTLMGVSPDTPAVSRFVTLFGEPYLIRYNSALPVVVYVPEDAEVRYRLWSAGPEMIPMDKAMLQELIAEGM